MKTKRYMDMWHVTEGAELCQKFKTSFDTADYEGIKACRIV